MTNTDNPGWNCSTAQEENTAESDRGFVTAPTADQLKPTERETFLLEELCKWQESSAKSRIVLGQPLTV